MLRMVKTAGVQDKKNHVITSATDMKMLDHQTAIAVDLDHHLLLVVGMLVNLLQTAVAMARILTMREVLLRETEAAMIVDEVAGPAETTIANAALPVLVVAQHHQDMVEEINGLAMITQSVVVTLKVLKENNPANLDRTNRIQFSAVPCSLEASRKSQPSSLVSLAYFTQMLRTRIEKYFRPLWQSPNLHCQ